MVGLPLNSFVSVLDRVRKQTREVVSDVWRQATLLLAAPMEKTLDTKMAERSPRCARPSFQPVEFDLSLSPSVPR